jgi:hypothetical protein
MNARSWSAAGIIVVALAGLGRAGEAEAIKALDQKGATFLHVDNNPQKPVRSIYLPGKKVTDADLKHLKVFSQLRILKLDAATNITDAGLKELVSLKQLQELGLGSTQVTDAGLKHLAALKNLKVLNLNFTRVSDTGIQQLTLLPQLESVAVSFTGVTPKGATKLQESLPKCKVVR